MRILLGLVIEMLIEAFTTCVMSGASTVTIEQFVEAFSNIYGMRGGAAAFIMRISSKTKPLRRSGGLPDGSRCLRR